MTLQAETPVEAHTPTPVQLSPDEPFFIRCSCGFKTSQYSFTGRSAWAEYRRHWVKETGAIVAPLTPRQMQSTPGQLFDPDAL